MNTNLKCVNCEEYLFHQPMQCPCGDRLCGFCFDSFKTSNSIKPVCPLCKSEILLEDCFRDRAATVELRKATLQCTSPGCSWEGPSDKYQDHFQSCQYCPHNKYGCEKVLQRSEMDAHLDKCEYKPLQCKWCGEDVEVHKKDCQMAPQYCGNRCGELVPRKDGNFKALNEHYPKCQDYYQVMQRLQYLERENSDLKLKLNQTQQVLTMTELEVQALQAKSYNGVYIWKVEDVQRCCCEAKSSETCFLYSEPFYTCRDGYRVCLRLYMNGDGIGKGTHLSLYLVVMKGDNDDILTWPFNKKVSVMILNQRSGPNVIQSLQPDRAFQRPQNSDMNIASGCPQFAPLALLSDPSYVKCDAMYIKFKVEKIKTLTITLDLD